MTKTHIRLATLGIGLAILTGCGSSAGKGSPSEIDKRTAFERSMATWDEYKRQNEVSEYSYIYNRFNMPDDDVYYLVVGVRDDVPVCRQQIFRMPGPDRKGRLEKGKEVNSNHWEGAPLARTMEEIHTECRRLFSLYEDLEIAIHRKHKFLLWCDGAFGLPLNEGAANRGFFLNDTQCFR